MRISLSPKGMPVSHTVFIDSNLSDEARRTRLFAGDLLVFGRRDSVLAFARFAQAMVAEAFAPLDPLTAQRQLTVEKFAEILGELKPRFIHAAESKRHIQMILEDFGCDAEATYFDVPRLRSSTSDNYLTTGIAYAWHPHRDTWYSAPACQVNWWMPVYELESENTMAIHPAYWNTAVPNDSARYNYYEWNKLHRGEAVAKLTKSDARPLPRPTGPIALEPQIRPVCPVGGIVLFSGAQLHSSVPNTSGKTRYSIDFRVVNLHDAAALRGAPKTDEACTGTAIRDYLRASDFARLPDRIVELHDDGTSGRGAVLYEHRSA
jgi:hypothetical protein